MVKKKNTTHRLKPFYPMLGFTTNKGLLLDLDKVSYSLALQIAENFNKKHHLKGYILNTTSKGNYNIIFNKPLTTTQIHTIAGKVYFYLLSAKGKKTADNFGLWFILQCVKKAMTVRISPKLSKPEPRIIKMKGKLDQICKQYLETFDLYKEIYRNT